MNFSIIVSFRDLMDPIENDSICFPSCKKGGHTIAAPGPEVNDDNNLPADTITISIHTATTRFEHASNCFGGNRSTLSYVAIFLRTSVSCTRPRGNNFHHSHWRSCSAEVLQRFFSEKKRKVRFFLTLEVSLFLTSLNFQIIP